MIRLPKAVGLMVVTIAAVGLVPGAHAVDAISRYSFDGGGVAFVSGGGYRLGATIGQPDAGSLAAGAFTLRGGFWIGGQVPMVGVADRPVSEEVFRFFPTRPNPVRARSRVAFDLPRSSRVALSIFDVSGRVVRRWDYGLLPAGHQERVWSSVDDGGRPLPGGVYFLRLDTDREQGVHKVLVLR